MAAVTTLMGLIGHSLNGNLVNHTIATPLAIVAVIGGLIGSKFAFKNKPKNLRIIFAVINLLRPFLMIIKIVV